MLERAIGAVRRNHALEHATVTLILSQLGPTRIVARANRDGFYIWGRIATDDLESAVREALRRLKSGEAHLAVTPLCGTNIAVGGLLAGGGALLAGGRRPADRVPAALTAAMLGIIASQPVGRWVQEKITTSADLDGMEFVGVRRMGERFHKVETKWVPREVREFAGVPA